MRCFALAIAASIAIVSCSQAAAAQEPPMVQLTFGPTNDRYPASMMAFHHGSRRAVCSDCTP